MDARLPSRQALFARMTGTEQALFLADEFRKACSLVLPAVSPRSSTPGPLSQKLSRLLQISKQLRHELKLSLDRLGDSFLALSARARLASQRVCSQHYVNSLRLKRKVKALLAQKGLKAQKLF